MTHPVIIKTVQEESHTEHLPRKFILALKLSSLGHASRKSSDREEMWFLLRFKIFSSFRLKGEHIPGILFLGIRDNMRLELHKFMCFQEKNQNNLPSKNGIRADVLILKSVVKKLKSIDRSSIINCLNLLLFYHLKLIIIEIMLAYFINLINFKCKATLFFLMSCSFLTLPKSAVPASLPHRPGSRGKMTADYRTG